MSQQFSSTPPHGDQTLSQWVDWVQARMEAAQICFGHGTDNARDEAVWLVSHALQIDPATAACHAASQPTAAQAQAIMQLVRRRIDERLPAAYLTGQAWFAGLDFEVDRNTLIPRSPLAELITGGLSMWPLAAGDQVLDLCTGCGCIAIALATCFPALAVDASDLSSAALRVATRNVQKHECEDRVTLLQSDLFASMTGRRYQLIVSNPPYVGSAELAQLPPEYQHEPELALASGADGLDLPLQILAQAGAHLAPGGHLILEVGNADQALTALTPQMALTWLEFEHGGHGVLTLSKELLDEYRPAFETIIRDRSKDHNHGV